MSALVEKALCDHLRLPIHLLLRLPGNLPFRLGSTLTSFLGPLLTLFSGSVFLKTRRNRRRITNSLDIMLFSSVLFCDASYGSISILADVFCIGMINNGIWHEHASGIGMINNGI